MHTLRRTPLTFRLLVLVVIIAGAPRSSRAEEASAQRNWIPTWAASAQSAGPFPADFTDGFDNQTIRQIVHISVGGTAVRLRLTNAFGENAVRFDSVYVGLHGNGASVRPGTNRRVTFAGQPAITIPAGASTVSDPVNLTVLALQDLVVSLHAPGITGKPTMHLFASQFNFLSEAGDFAAEEGSANFPILTFGCWYYMDGVDVLASPSVKGAVVALGDSLTDSLFSTPDANNRYPDFLARRILAGPPGGVLGVLNAGVTGNRILSDSPCFGVNVGARLDREVLARRGVVAVIFTMGSNDFGFPEIDEPPPGLPPECFQPATEVSAAEVIEGYRQVIARVRAAGIRIFGATVSPATGSSAAYREKRRAVNAWIRQSGEFDGVFDFAAAVADPRDPDSLAPWFDSGDGIHLNDEGYAAMANAVNLGLFR
jgi:lysophospholipase L1-like esterase